MEQYLITITESGFYTTNTVIAWSKTELCSVITRLKENEVIRSIKIINNAINCSEWSLDRQNDEVDGFKKITGV